MFKPLETPIVVQSRQPEVRFDLIGEGPTFAKLAVGYRQKKERKKTDKPTVPCADSASTSFRNLFSYLRIIHWKRIHGLGSTVSKRLQKPCISYLIHLSRSSSYLSIQVIYCCPLVF